MTTIVLYKETNLNFFFLNSVNTHAMHWIVCAVSKIGPECVFAILNLEMKSFGIPLWGGLVGFIFFSSIKNVLWDL